jgi:hypothetical protein
MFSREESSQLRQEFWTAFGKYMNPVPSAEGTKVNWINYHTRVKDLYFRMEAEKRLSSIGISIEHRDLEIQELYFEQFLQLKQMLHTELQEEWIWNLHETVDGKTTSRIYKELSGPSVYNKDHWPELISFFKPRIIALDSFWENAKWSFESLK